MRRLTLAMFTVGAMAFSASAQTPTNTVAGFDGGSDDGFSGNALFEASDGNPGGAARHVTDLFFNELRTGAEGEPANTGFLGDYSGFTNIKFSVDVRTNSLTNFFGDEISRAYGIMLIDRDIVGPSGPSGVFYELGIMGVDFTPDWTTHSVIVSDPTSAALPAGWIGFGDEHPTTFEPILPAGATFATVLAGVDEVRITGAIPGFFFGSAFWDVQVDNISVVVTAPCEPCDTNCDGSVNPFDIQSFLEVLGGGSGCSPCAGDTNGNGTVNPFDINDFVACLS